MSTEAVRSPRHAAIPPENIPEQEPLTPRRMAVVAHMQPQINAIIQRLDSLNSLPERVDQLAERVRSRIGPWTEEEMQCLQEKERVCKENLRRIHEGLYAGFGVLTKEEEEAYRVREQERAAKGDRIRKSGKNPDYHAHMYGDDPWEADVDEEAKRALGVLPEQEKPLAAVVLSKKVRGEDSRLTEDCSPQFLRQYLSGNAERLATITQLSLVSLGLTHVPPEMGMLTGLVECNLSRNHLSDLPRECAAWMRLNKLSISENRFQAFPEVIFSIENLNYLDVSRNSIDRLPQGLNRMPCLGTVRVEGNPIAAADRGLRTTSMEIFLDDSKAKEEELSRLRSREYCTATIFWDTNLRFK